MEFIVIPLAQRKLKQRGISAIWIEETISKPEQTVSGYAGRTVYQRRYKGADQKEKLLRVVCEVKEGKQIVITAYLTSEIHRYWRK